MSFTSGLKRGFVMAVIAYEFMLKHKKTVLFTLLSAFLAIGVLFSFIGYFLVKTGAAEGIREGLLGHHITKQAIHHIAPSSLIMLVLLLVIAGFLNTFIKVGLATYIGNVIENKPTGFFSAMGNAFSRFGIIIKWIIINWIVGSLIRSLQRRGGILGSLLGGIISGLLSLGWYILTFFVIPIMATEDLGIIKTIELSGQSMKKTFGQNVSATFAIRGAGSLFSMIIILPFWLLAFLIWEGFGHAILEADSSGTLLVVLGLGTIALPLLITTPITVAANMIFRVASYNYATGKPTGPFSPDMIKQSFVSKVM